MSVTQGLFVVATVLTAIGLWLMLPSPGPGADRRRWLGVGFSAVAFGLFAAEFTPLGNWVANAQFYVLAFVTVVAAVGTITMRSPVYCALWFALSLLGTAGLFLCQGAQFLGVATIVVYAGAILVTFLFVLMLAQPQGNAFSDRLSFDAPLSAAAGAVLIGILTMTITAVLRPDGQPVRTVHTVTDAQRQAEVLNPDHMAHLGGELFSRQLISVEVAGTLLLIALVGTIAIVAQLKTLHHRGDRRHG